MLKKLIAAAAGAGLILTMAGTAFAFDFNFAKVKNIVVTKADTGDNSIHGKFVGGGEITTGSATAGADLYNVVNATEGGHNFAKVKNVVITKADSGDNEIGGKYVFGGEISTGEAEAYSIVTNFVNTTVVGG